MTDATIVSISVAFAALVLNGLVGLGVEGSNRTKISGVFAAGWLMLMEGLGFIGVWYVDALPHSMLMGICFAVIGLGIVSLPIVSRELHHESADR